MSRFQTIFALALVVPVHAACLGRDTESVVVPFPGLGDRVSYLVRKDLGVRVQEDLVNFTVESVDSVTMPDGRRQAGVKINQTWYTPGFRRQAYFWIALAGDFALREEILCLTRREDRCPRETGPAVKYGDVEGAPWAFGSSLFQGSTWVRGAHARLDPAIHGRAVGLEVASPAGRRPASPDSVILETVARGGHGNVQGEWYAVEGEFELRNGVPYVQHAAMTVAWTTFDLSPAFTYSVQVDLVAAQLSGEPIEFRRADTVPPLRQCIASTGPRTEGLPPGSDFQVPEFNASFQEMARAFEARSQGYQAAEAQRDFRVTGVLMQEVARSSLSPAGMTLQESRTVEADIAYVASRNATRSGEVERTVNEPNPLGRPPEYRVREDATDRAAREIFVDPSKGIESRAVPFDAVYRAGRGVVDRPLRLVGIETVANGFPSDSEFASLFDLYTLGFDVPAAAEGGVTPGTPIRWDATTGCLWDALLAPPETIDGLIGNLRPA